MDIELLLATARHNEQIWRQFQTFELELLACRHWQGLFDMLFVTLPERLGFCSVQLAIFDPNKRMQQSLSRQLGDAQRYQAKLQFLPSLPGSLQQAHVLLPHELALTRFHSGLHLPLRKQRQVFGYLRLFSLQPNRFDHDRATDFIEHTVAVFAAAIELVLQTEEIERLAYEDPLTRVRNRRGMSQAFDAQLARSLREKQSLGMALIDLDHFKSINDRYGHATGDRTLVHFCALARSCLRPFDYLGRMGGEEFLLILPACDPDVVRQVVERIRVLTEQTYFFDDKQTPFNLTVSGGMGSLQAKERTLEDVMSVLDKGLYQAKQQGRNRMTRVRL